MCPEQSGAGVWFWLCHILTAIKTPHVLPAKEADPPAASVPYS